MPCRSSKTRWRGHSMPAAPVLLPPLGRRVKSTTSARMSAGAAGMSARATGLLASQGFGGIDPHRS
jgi:hypothetical protein